MGAIINADLGTVATAPSSVPHARTHEAPSVLPSPTVPGSAAPAHDFLTEPDARNNLAPEVTKLQGLCDSTYGYELGPSAPRTSCRSVDGSPHPPRRRRRQFRLPPAHHRHQDHRRPPAWASTRPSSPPPSTPPSKRGFRDMRTPAEFALRPHAPHRPPPLPPRPREPALTTPAALPR